MPVYCYMVECADGSFYTGWSTDPVRRARQHNRGVGARYTRLHRPVRLVYVEEQPDVSSALKRVAVNDQRKAGGWSDQEVADLALAEVQASGSCLVIVNTKASARRIFELCPTAMEPDLVFHLSTDMCPAHRKARLAALLVRLKADQPTLCVSTQLIEAGVDVDFGSVIRFMAGLDSIAQAAGRCNRNGLRATGSVHVVNPQVESLDKLPDILQGRNAALRVLDEFQQKLAPVQTWNWNQVDDPQVDGQHANKGQHVDQTHGSCL